MSGTSMASPHVAGAAALLASAGWASPEGIQTELINQGKARSDGVTTAPLLDVAHLAAPSDGALDGAVPDDAPPPVLEATASKEKGRHVVELAWNQTKVGGEEVTVRRDGVVITGMPTDNDGSHVDYVGGRGAAVYSYVVCPSDADTGCTAPAEVTF